MHPSPLQQAFDSEHPVALVTGSGAPRVGRAIAKHLASLGCNVALHANSSVAEAKAAATELSEAYGVDVMVTQGSLADESVPPRLIAEVVDAFGRLDILVNSAAIWSPTSLDEVTADEIRRYFDINSVGTFLCSRASGLQMVSQSDGGCIINLGDWATTRPYLDHAAYFPSKGSIETMTRSLAVELGTRNPKVRVNCIQPGPVLLADDVSADVRERLIESTLVGRIGTPRDIGLAVQMLCENTFITGVCLPVDGGRSIFSPDGLQTGYNTG